MVHQYINNGYHIVLDVNSGAIHVVDEVVYDVIPLFEKHSSEQIVELLSDRYTKEELEEAVAEVAQLKEEGSLFT
ncbi:MAG: PqqD family peptide modification chaperone, partial [Lachnospiraceae bacterium]